jgi:hypothetical protein
VQRPINEFAIFAQDQKGPMWRATIAGLEEAKRLAQKLTDEEGIEFFVFSFRTLSEVARCVPNPNRGRREGEK